MAIERGIWSKRIVEGIKKGEVTVTGLTSSYTIYQAAKKSWVKCYEVYKNGKVMYRINASEDALKALGVKPDFNARKAIKQNRNHLHAPLNYYDRKSGTQVWSKTGKEVIIKHPAMTEGCALKAFFWPSFEASLNTDKIKLIITKRLLKVRPNT